MRIILILGLKMENGPTTIMYAALNRRERLFQRRNTVGKSTNGSWTLGKKVLVALGVVIVLVGVQLIINHRLIGISIELLEKSRGKGFAGVGIASDIKLNVLQVQELFNDWIMGGSGYHSLDNHNFSYLN